MRSKDAFKDRTSFSSRSYTTLPDKHAKTETYLFLEIYLMVGFNTAATTKS
ncbi:MAG: hypothetical protein AAGI49_14790 [Bacteroidota bacterium]